MKPQYIIIGGVNGAGKSTLYRTNPQIFGDTRRLNADEILRAAGGDWRNPADTAVDRVAARVAKGGHGVDEADIRRRYDSSHANLQVLASSVDTLRVFDNTRWYEPAYWRAGSKVLLDESRYGLHLS